jgi:hypothetical protein
MMAGAIYGALQKSALQPLIVRPASPAAEENAAGPAQLIRAEIVAYASTRERGGTGFLQMLQRCIAKN